MKHTPLVGTCLSKAECPRFASSLSPLLGLCAATLSWAVSDDKWEIFLGMSKRRTS